MLTQIMKIQIVSVSEQVDFLLAPQIGISVVFTHVSEIFSGEREKESIIRVRVG